VRSTFDTCRPRGDILAGTFNPEIFTASLSQVIDFYRGRATTLHNLYTDADAFLAEATYPTRGMRQVLFEVFGRLAGNNTLPAIHRLETGFGGGKTHTLIACAHLAYQGRDLRDLARSTLDTGEFPVSAQLGPPRGVTVVGIAGDRLPVVRARGDALVPATLWAEIARQVGGEELLAAAGAEALAPAAPGEDYFKLVLGGRKVLVMLDELAQYATRLHAVQPDGGAQVAAFLMGLHGYARDNPGVAVVLTLASQQDAFARETGQIRQRLAEVMGREVSADEAVQLSEKALKDTHSVVARDATPVTPVQAGEITRILAKRLFEAIDEAAAREAASTYAEMYRRNRATFTLPEEASPPEEFQKRMAASYPFHPTLTDFLNKKLAMVETFQGTRGVLRVLAQTVRSLWHDRPAVLTMIHSCHINLRDPAVVSEILGRTGAGDLAGILNADVGGADTNKLEGGVSNAELADRKNRHPEGIPFHEYTWRSVFLHSLVGRDRGLASEAFGVDETQALFDVAQPGLPPSQVKTALEEIRKSAYYLHHDDKAGRYYASPEVSVNVVLARIRRSLGTEPVRQLLAATARKVVKEGISEFLVKHDVRNPEDVPDRPGRPVLALVRLDAGVVDVNALVTTQAPSQARTQQNTVLLLVPDTVTLQPAAGDQKALFGGPDEAARAAYEALEDLAREVQALRTLHERPQDHGISRARLAEQQFEPRLKERENALVGAVTAAYSSLWFPSAASGQVDRRDVKVAGGGEGGANVVEAVRAALLGTGELLTADGVNLGVLNDLARLFFVPPADTVTVARVRDNFLDRRDWPMLDGAGVLEKVVRSGVEKGVWCLYRMGGPDSARPAEFYSRQKGPLPYQLDLARGEYGLVTPEGAKKRGWDEDKDRPDARKVEEWVKDVLVHAEGGALTVADLAAKVVEGHGEVPAKDVREAVVTLARENTLVGGLYEGTPTQAEKPAKIVRGALATLHTPADGEVVITRAKIAERGWDDDGHAFRLSGHEGAVRLVPLLRRVGQFYSRGAKTTVTMLDVVDLKLPEGGRLRIALEEVPPESMRLLGELFETLDRVAKVGEKTEGHLEIADPDPGCPFLQQLQKAEAAPAAAAGGGRR
jgi:hypothetical protein